METGQYIKDGEVTWIVTDVRDTSRAGHITLETELLPGYLKLNGAAVTASEYPRLVTWREKQSDTVKSLFAYDESADTLTLPDLRGRFLEGGDSIALVEAGLPNITATMSFNEMTGVGGNGSAYISGRSYRERSFRITGDGYQYYVALDASRSSPIYGASDAVQPAAITLIAQIKY